MAAVAGARVDVREGGTVVAVRASTGGRDDGLVRGRVCSRTGMAGFAVGHARGERVFDALATRQRRGSSRR